ncbi:MAG: hypothetical protein AAGD13_00685 [Pseudomonadota bacterium]
MPDRLEALARNANRLRRTKRLAFLDVDRAAGHTPGTFSKIVGGRARARGLEAIIEASRLTGRSCDELLRPAAIVRGDRPDDAAAPPPFRSIDRPPADVFERELAERAGQIDDDDELLDLVEIWRIPDPATLVPVSELIGRHAALAVETGIDTPEAIDRLLENSPPETSREIARGHLAAAKAPVTSDRRQSMVFLPPYYFLTFLLDRRLFPVIWRGRKVILHYSFVRAITRRPDPERVRSENLRLVPTMMSHHQFDIKGW